MKSITCRHICRLIKNQGYGTQERQNPAARKESGKIDIRHSYDIRPTTAGIVTLVSEVSEVSENPLSIILRAR